MEDAYVIGIRLALENGVSVGITSIAADLHALDAAIAVTQANLQRLQTLALHTDLPRPATRIERASATSAPPADAPILAPATPPAPASSPGGVAPEAARAGAPAISARAEIAPPAASPATPQAAPIIRILTPPSPASAPSQAATSSVAPPAPASAPAPAVLASNAETSRAPRPAASPPSDSRPATTSIPPPASAAPAARMPDRDIAPAASAAPREPSATPRGPIREASAPSRPPPLVDFRQPAPAAPPSYPATQAAPPAREAHAGAMQGDVYLDGTRLGRWMSDRLARDAGRPQSGATGFDPRLGPAWPGPLQGS